MDYFNRLSGLLEIERQEELSFYDSVTRHQSASERRANGVCWYPVAIRDNSVGRGDYISLELERTTHRDLPHQFRFGTAVALFSNHNAADDRLEGTVTFQGDHIMKVSFRVDELPDWVDNGKLGVDLLPDNSSFKEMQSALKRAAGLVNEAESGHIVRILTGAAKPSFTANQELKCHDWLNDVQQVAVKTILSARDLAIIHGPPGTGKTTTLIKAIAELARQETGKILVVAPSNAAVDLLTERLNQEGLSVLRIGNPARISEQLGLLSLDEKIARHSQTREIKSMRKRAGDFLNMAHKYKRHFGKAEREQRKALFDEAHKILKDVERVEQYIVQDLLNQTQVVTATLVGAHHYTVRGLQYSTVVIDEAGQALEPAAWIPILKGQRIVMAGDHCQLPPTVKSVEAERQGLGQTLMEKCVALHPESVVLLEKQYRMHTHIMDYPSRVFYGGRLKADPAVAHHVLFANDNPLLFIDTAGCGFEEKAEGTSITNPEEAAFLWQHLSAFLNHHFPSVQGSEQPSIAVISPYRQQVEILNTYYREHSGLKAYSHTININTIDSFQGQEKDIVYISMVRSNTEGNIGFLSDIRRMNVAMTRARKKLVVIGDSATISQLPFYQGFIDYAMQQEAYESAWTYSDLFR